jgi:hypothetical protein
VGNVSESVASPEEWKKAILSMALAASPLVLLANVTGTLQSDALDAVLTGTEFQEKGANEESTQRFHSVFVVTASPPRRNRPSHFS